MEQIKSQVSTDTHHSFVKLLLLFFRNCLLCVSFIYSVYCKQVFVLFLNLETGSPPKVKNATAKMLSPRRSDHRIHSTIPQVLAQGAITIAKSNCTIAENESRPSTSTIQMVVSRLTQA